MPSFTFVSTANAFVLRGATPVFVDIRPDTLNIDETQIEAAITPRTKAIVPVHYAGVGCEMDAIMAIAERHGLLVIEDAAQGVMRRLQGPAARSHRRTSRRCQLPRDQERHLPAKAARCSSTTRGCVERAEIIWEKGTNRSQFFRGQVDKYTWVDVGSSYLPSEIVAAFLWAQLEEADAITGRRRAIWSSYHEAFEPWRASGHRPRARSSRRSASTTAISTTCSCPTSPPGRP